MLPFGIPASFAVKISCWSDQMNAASHRERSCEWTLVLFLTSCCLWASAQKPAPTQVDGFPGRPRVIVISDIGNEPDDQMSLVRFLLYSNQFEVEALIASTSTWQKAASHPETMHQLIDTYGEVRPNLLQHAKGWPTAEYLHAQVFSGQPGYGMAATGSEKMSPGAEAIIRAADRNDPRPLWISIWGGANTLAQALLQLRATRKVDDVEKFVSKLRVYSINDQDDAGPWLRREFPNLFYIVRPSPPNGEEYSYATWTGISGDAYYRNCAGANTTLVTNEWLDANVRKGPLGKLYPKFLFIMEGDTPSFLGLVDNGLNAYRRPDWGGWGGRYVYRQPYGETHPIWTQGGDEFFRTKASQDTVTGVDGEQHTSDQATIWRWRDAYQNDFAARMDWTIKDFAHANHNPVVDVNGQVGTAPIEIDSEVGKPLVLDASRSSDPDNQRLHFKWFVYPEAGGTETNLSDVKIDGADRAKAVVTPTAVCRSAWLAGVVPCKGNGVVHVILAVTDEGTPQLTSYRRIIVNVRAATH